MHWPRNGQLYPRQCLSLMPASTYRILEERTRTSRPGLYYYTMRIGVKIRLLTLYLEVSCDIRPHLLYFYEEIKKDIVKWPEVVKCFTEQSWTDNSQRQVRVSFCYWIKCAFGSENLSCNPGRKKSGFPPAHGKMSLTHACELPVFRAMSWHAKIFCGSQSWNHLIFM